MNVLILGMDGYIGWSLSQHLAEQGNKVVGIDNFSRRRAVEEIGSWSATPIANMERRMHQAKAVYQDRLKFHEGDLTDYRFVQDLLKSFKPDVIVHLGEQPSAPYSMIDVEHAVETQQNNIVGTLNVLFAMRDYAPDAHLLKLGTMGEYGTPPIDIPEGFFEVEHNGRRANLMFPRQPGSWYHASKVHDTYNVMLACRIWGLRSTDVMQGVVYGTRTNEVDPIENPEMCTRFDFDELFGTCVNRYCSEAVIGHPLTVYGKGGQTRGFLALVDSIQCLTLICNNPPSKGEYRVFNQLDETYSVEALAKTVGKVAERKGLGVAIRHVTNPRKEAEDHHYKVEVKHLRNLGFRPTRTLESELDIMLDDLMAYKERIKEKEYVIDPKTTWQEGNKLISRYGPLEES